MVLPVMWCSFSHLAVMLSGCRSRDHWFRFIDVWYCGGWKMHLIPFISRVLYCQKCDILCSVVRKPSYEPGSMLDAQSLIKLVYLKLVIVFSESFAEYFIFVIGPTVTLNTCMWMMVLSSLRLHSINQMLVQHIWCKCVKSCLCSQVVWLIVLPVPNSGKLAWIMDTGQVMELGPFWICMKVSWIQYAS